MDHKEKKMAVKQTAGRDALGEFASKFAQLNDDVLFGEVWSREDMQDGPRHGQHFGWRRESGQKKVPKRMRSPHMQRPCCFL